MNSIVKYSIGTQRRETLYGCKNLNTKVSLRRSSKRIGADSLEV